MVLVVVGVVTALALCDVVAARDERSKRARLDDGLGLLRDK